MLMNKLKADNLQARKNRDEVASGLLTALVGEAAMVGKNNGNRETTDEEALRVIKKFLDNAKETKNLVNPKYIDTLNQIEKEISILEKYMPEQFTEEKLKFLITEYRNENPDANMGHIMKYLQANYSGQYDGKLASQIAKGL